MKKIFLTTLAISLLFACSHKDKKAQLEKLKKQQSELTDKIKKLENDIAKAGGGDENKKFKNVLVTTLNPQSFRHFIEVQAKIDGDENVSISAKMGGTVSRILVNAGDEVKEGQVLAELDNALIAQGIQELQTAKEFATTMYLKQKNLWEQKIGSEVQYLTAKNSKESLDRKLATLQEQLDMTKIKSPINGMVDFIDIKIGQAVMPGISVMRVVNFLKLKVKAEVAENYISRVKKGNDVIVFLPDINQEITAKVSYSAKVINVLNRTFNVEVNLDPKDDNLHPNMIAILKIVDYKADSTMVVPINMLQNDEDKQYVYVASKENDKFVAKKQIVTAGQSYNGLVEITKGLNAGTQLITTGYQNLNEGEAIKY